MRLRAFRDDNHAKSGPARGARSPTCRNPGLGGWAGRLLLDRVGLGRSGDAGALAVLATLVVPLHLGLLAVGLVGGRRRRRLRHGGEGSEGTRKRERCSSEGLHFILHWLSRWGK